MHERITHHLPYPPNSFFVTPVLGSRIRNNHGSWGKKVATLNAIFILSVDSISDAIFKVLPISGWEDVARVATWSIPVNEAYKDDDDGPIDVLRGTWVVEIGDVNAVDDDGNDATRHDTKNTTNKRKIQFILQGGGQYISNKLWCQMPPLGLLLTHSFHYLPIGLS